MASTPDKQPIPHQPLVVATLHSKACLDALNALKPGEVDLVELRADAFLPDPAEAVKRVRQSGWSWILTLRDRAEGGHCNLPPSERAGLLQGLAPDAAFIDVEISNMDMLSPVIHGLREAGANLVFSAHDFDGMPDGEAILRMAQEAGKEGACVFKFAGMAHSRSDVGTLLRVLDECPVPASLMGMGEWGTFSRLALALAGSVFNYGHLGVANAPGQWFAPDLKRAILSSREAMARSVSGPA